MKTNRLVLTSLLLLLPLLCQAQKNKVSIFEKYSEMNHVSSIYISKAMIDMMTDFQADDINISKIAKQLNRIEILSTDNATIKKSMKKDIDELTDYYYELMMKQKGQTSSMAFYSWTQKGKIISFIVLIDAPNTLKYIRLDGNMNLKDIQNIISQQNSSLNK